MSDDPPYPSLATQQRLAQLLGLPFADDMQDWEFVVATPDTVIPALRLYRTVESAEERWSLMQLMLSGLEEAAWQEQLTEDAWDEVSEILRRDHEMHRHTIRYWACLGGDAAFAIAPRMRELWTALYEP